MDQGLLQQALSAGAEVRFSDRVERVTGPAVLGIGPRVAEIIAVGYLFETDMASGNWICFDDSLAPLGYAYLLVNDGRGTVATCMFTGFKLQHEYVDRTVKFFQEHAGLEMRNPRPFGGFGNIRLPRRAVQGGHLVIGEQAGFQDAVAGFGLRYALRSRILAAKSQLERVDYTELWRQHLLPQLRTSVSLRFIFNLLGDRAWHWILGNWVRGKDARRAMRRLYQPSTLLHLLFPLAHWRYRVPLQDRSCDHVDCQCVWCTCGGPDTPMPRLD